MTAGRNPPEARVDPDLEPIAGRLRAVRDLITRISGEVGPAAFRGMDGVIARHRAEVAAAMEALGMALYEFVQSQPPPDRIEAAKSMVLAWLREFSLTSPIMFYGSQGKRRRLAYFEVIAHLWSQTAAGADVPARVLDDYYVHMRLGEAFINRLNRLTLRLLDHAAGCLAQGNHPMHLISLQYVGGNDLLPLARSADTEMGIEVTCVDDSAAAVRDAEHRLKPAFGSRVRCLMSDPVKWLHGPARASESVDVVYAAALLEHLPDDKVVSLLAGAHRVLRPGGVLLSGCTPGNVPVAEHMLRNLLLSLAWPYRSESDWRALFSQTPFGGARLDFEYEPLGISAVLSVEKEG